MTTPVTTPTRNGPCPCGSGVKYKKCCLPKENAAVAGALPPGSRVVNHRGQTMLASRGVSSADLDRGADHFAQRARGGGAASKMMRFAEPLLDAAGGDHENMNCALTLAIRFWNLALCKGAQYDEMLAELTRSIVRDANEDEASAFRATTAVMVERHRRMFPEMHRFR